MNVVATKSKKAARIESTLLNKLAMMGQKTFAKAMGVPEYQVSRWKNGFFSQVSMMLAVLEYGIEDEEMAELTRRLATYLTKKKPRRTANSSRPDVEILDQSTGVIMPKQLSPDQDKLHKNILRDRFLSSFKQPGRFRAELEKVKLILKRKGHE